MSQKAPELCLIDADSLTYQIAYKQPNNFKAKIEFDLAIENIIKSTECSSSMVFIKGEDNFRTQYETYKANRVDNIDPAVKARVIDIYEHAKEYCVESDKGEADDYVCFTALQAAYDNIPYTIVHIDKDLDCIPGWHYNFRKGKSYFVTYEDAYRFQIKQLLQGDATDNIKGIKGLGPITADKIVTGEELHQLWDILIDNWQKKMKRSWKKQFIECANLIYLRESYDDLRPLDFEELKERLTWKTPDTGLPSVQDPKTPLDSFTPSLDPQEECTLEESN